MKKILLNRRLFIELTIAVILGLSAFLYSGLFMALTSSASFLFFIALDEKDYKKSLILFNSSVLFLALYLGDNRLWAFKNYLIFFGIGFAVWIIYKLVFYFFENLDGVDKSTTP